MCEEYMEQCNDARSVLLLLGGDLEVLTVLKMTTE